MSEDLQESDDIIWTRSKINSPRYSTCSQRQRVPCKPIYEVGRGRRRCGMVGIERIHRLGGKRERRKELGLRERREKIGRELMSSQVRS